MRFRRSRGQLLGMIGACLLAISASSWGGVEDTADAFMAWRDFSTLLLYWWGTGRCPSPEWLDREFDVADPDSGQAVRAADVVLMKAFDGYGQDSIAIGGRIPLDVNPQCILGLYAADRFSGTRLENWGRMQFEQCVEHACLVAMPSAGNTWAAGLEAELLAVDKTRRGPLEVGAFAWAEVPYLYLYLVNMARSDNAQYKARECLARCLLEKHGLEPGLRQYLVLFDQGCKVGGTWLDVATQLDRVGSHHKVKKLYRQILKDADSAEEAREACEKLARILLSESRQREARAVLGILSQRFPNTECIAPDIRDFMSSYQVNREETSRRLIGELAKTRREARVLQLCRLFDALWTPQEAPQQWQAVVNAEEPGSLAEQVGRLFLARAMLAAGKADAADVALRGLSESLSPFVQGQSIAVSAGIAQVRGNVTESARLYLRAIEIDRPTPLPGWCEGLVPIRSLDVGMTASELQAQTSFLKGYNHLIDGDFAAAADSFGQVASDPRSLPKFLRRVLPCTMMLVYLGVGDYAGAEAWGHQALEQYRKDNPDDDKIIDFLAEIQNLDTAVSQLAANVRGRASDTPAASPISQQAIHIYDAGMSLNLFGLSVNAIRGGVQQLYVRAKRRHIARVLAAEHRYARQRLIGSGMTERLSDLEPLVFAAQMLSENTFDEIKENLASAAEGEGPGEQMYRFAAFARNLHRPDLARRALDVALSEQTSVANVEILEGIADMYLAASNHQKAIEAYEIIVANSKDPNKAQTAQLKIIDIYAKDLGNYDKAIQKCEEFIRRYPDSHQTSQVEFFIGKFAYLNRDFAGAVGQLDGFRKRYPGHPQVGQVMILAGLSRMAEGNSQEAVGRFSEVIRRYPDGDLAARSKFLIAYAQMSEQRYHDALETFRQLVEQFPKSQYVTHARSFIDRLSKASK